MRTLLIIPFLLSVSLAGEVDPAQVYGIWRVDAEGADATARIHIGPTEWAVGSKELGYKKQAAKWLEGGRVQLEGSETPHELRLEDGKLYLKRDGVEVPLVPVRRLRDFHGAWRFDAAALDWDRVLAEVPEVIHDTVRENTRKYALNPRSRFVFSEDVLVLVRGDDEPSERPIVSWQLVDETTALVKLNRSAMELRLQDGRLEVFYPKSKVRWTFAASDESPVVPDMAGTWRFDKSKIDWDVALAAVAEENRDEVRANLEGAEDGGTTLVVEKDRIVWKVSATEGEEYPVSAWEQVGRNHLRAGFGLGGEYVDLVLDGGVLYLKSPREGAALPFSRVDAPAPVQAAAGEE